MDDHQQLLDDEVLIRMSLPPKPSFSTQLPLDVLRVIFTYINRYTRMSCRMVCRCFRHLLDDPQLKTWIDDFTRPLIKPNGYDWLSPYVNPVTISITYRTPPIAFVQHGIQLEVTEIMELIQNGCSKFILEMGSKDSESIESAHLIASKLQIPYVPIRSFFSRPGYVQLIVDIVDEIGPCVIFLRRISDTMFREFNDFLALPSGSFVFISTLPGSFQVENSNFKKIEFQLTPKRLEMMTENLMKNWKYPKQVMFGISKLAPSMDHWILFCLTLRRKAVGNGIIEIEDIWWMVNHMSDRWAIEYANKIADGDSILSDNNDDTSA
eukprot:TRINITY_DN9349_c0_g1_i1.p1 TRINITY_DN9349_c0_g1~~TRINITY_DN9349_c0_g1_i1.p1  ORF type:complete len:323 (+),score=77.14 TRINITY_DN9349_c0_g1_i1:63-1031(+)